MIGSRAFFRGSLREAETKLREFEWAKNAADVMEDKPSAIVDHWHLVGEDDRNIATMIVNTWSTIYGLALNFERCPFIQEAPEEGTERAARLIKAFCEHCDKECENAVRDILKRGFDMDMPLT